MTHCINTDTTAREHLAKFGRRLPISGDMPYPVCRRPYASISRIRQVTGVVLIFAGLGFPAASDASFISRMLASITESSLFRSSDPDPRVRSRLETKADWRKQKALLSDGRPRRKISFATNLERKVGQMGGRDESADPSAPFRLDAGDPLLPENMPAGTYWTNSGKYFYRSDSITTALQGGPEATQSFEFVYQHRMPDGRIVTQQGGYAAPDSSWGWDGRFEIQRKADGSEELVVTQGAMELPKKLRGASRQARDLPQVKVHNYTRSRHVFKIQKFENGKLYLLNEGSILRYEPDADGNWISYETVAGRNGRVTNVLKHAHGYGENYLESLEDPRRMAKDEFGYSIRMFDVVVEQLLVRWPDGRTEKIPSKTRTIGYRMDPRDPSKRVADSVLLPNGQRASLGILFASEELPGRPDHAVRSSIRAYDIRKARVLEVRTAHLDGTVTIDRTPAQEREISLVEGFNPVPGLITFPNGRKYFLATLSAGEYVWGGFDEKGKKPGRYGAYLGYRTETQGRIGAYRMITEQAAHGEDFVDFLEDFTELYGLSWGAGRPQAFQDEFGGWWMDVHAVDTDLLKEGLPKTGYPKSHSEFADGYRRQKIHIPIRWIERNGLPAFEIDDPEVRSAIEAYRAERLRLKQEKLREPSAIKPAKKAA